MKTKYLVTTTHPDTLDPEEYADKLENCTPYTAWRAARAGLKALAAHTNVRVYLLEVKCLAEEAGVLDFRDAHPLR